MVTRLLAYLLALVILPWAIPSPAVASPGLPSSPIQNPKYPKSQIQNYDDPPRLPPARDAPRGRVFAWTADAGSEGGKQGLRFTWALPKELEEGKLYDLVVICHGTGLDYRWGHANYPPEVFRPHDIVVSVDGTSPGPNDARVFLGERKDALLFRDFLLEMARAFPVNRIFLFGHSQGSFFVTYFAGEFPSLAEGVVAHASGAWSWTKTKAGTQQVPIVFMHGTKDPVVPYAQSVGARDAYTEDGHKMVLLRRLPAYNHWPNAARASECIDWCRGMKSPEAAEVLACAQELMRVKPPDQYSYQCAPPLGAARQLLLRLRLPEGDKAAPEDTTGQDRAKAEALLKQIEEQGARHVAALKRSVASPADLILGAGPDAGAWLGHLLSLREDFRGVESVEAYLKDIGWAEARTAHQAAAQPLLEAWYSGKPDKEKFEAVVDAMPRCFLVEALPFDLMPQMRTWHDKAKDLGLSEESLEKYDNVPIWDAAWLKGQDKYAEIWKK